MSEDGRRTFIESLLGAAALGVAGADTAGAAALPQPVPERALADRERSLAEALRALNDAAELGITPEELARAQAYATGALLETARRLRPLVLEDGLEPPLDFDARRRP
jgi:hypothetical protein